MAEITKAAAAKLKKPIPTASNVRTVQTSLINKDELFRMCALAESTHLPLLFEGPPGTGKTKTVIDYAKSWLQQNGATEEDFMNKLFLLETDEGTKASEVKGMADLEVLFTENKFKLNSPITEAEVIIINEIDKASPALRNALLGIMAEGFLWNGKTKIKCKWKLFIATCNEIPKEEENSPFWDRFILKTNVNRITANEMMTYYSKGGRDYRTKIDVPVPTSEEIKNVSIPNTKLEKFLSIAYDKLSDRTLSFIPTLAGAVGLVWKLSIDKALVRAASIMINTQAAQELQKKLVSAEMQAIMSKTEVMKRINTSEELDKYVLELDGMITGYAAQGKLDPDQVDELESTINYILDNHPVKNRPKDVEDMLEAALSGANTTNM